MSSDTSADNDSRYSTSSVSQIDFLEIGHYVTGHYMTLKERVLRGDEKTLVRDAPRLANRKKRTAHSLADKEITRPLLGLLHATLEGNAYDDVMGAQRSKNGNDITPTQEQLLQLITHAHSAALEIAPPVQLLKKYNARIAEERGLQARITDNSSILTCGDIKFIMDDCKRLRQAYNGMVMRERILKRFVGTVLSRCLKFEGRRHDLNEYDIQKLALFMAPDLDDAHKGTHEELEKSLNDFWALSDPNLFEHETPNSETLQKFMAKKAAKTGNM